MKCVKFIANRPFPETHRRVSDNIAAELVARGDWAYCGKQEWKKLIRDVKVVAPAPVAEEVAETQEKPKKPKGNPKGKAAKVAKEG